MERSGTILTKGDCPWPGSRGRFIIHCCVNVMSELGAVIGQREPRGEGGVGDSGWGEKRVRVGEGAGVWER